MSSPTGSLGKASGSRSIRHANSSDSLNSHPLIPSSSSYTSRNGASVEAGNSTSPTSPTDSSRLAPPPQQSTFDSSKPIHSRNASNSSLEAPSAASPSYSSLRYAPRQRATPAPYKASQPVFQSHGSAFNHAQTSNASAGLSSGATTPPAATARSSSPSRSALSSDNPPSNASASNATLSPPKSTPSGDFATNASSLSRAQLNKLRADAQELRLLPQSFGWALLERLQAATDGEWAALADLVSTEDVSESTEKGR